MNLQLGWMIGLQEMRTHKVRSFLTMIGIILGVASLSAMISLVQGMRESWMNDAEIWGGFNRLEVRSVPPPEKQQHIAHLSPGKTQTDVAVIKRNCNFAWAVSPEIEINPPRGYSMPVQRNGKVFKSYTVAGTPALLDVNNYETSNGRFIADMDLDRVQRVAVIGSEVQKQLFSPGENPIGQFLWIKGTCFTVIGILKHYEQLSRDGSRNYLSWRNKFVFIPLTTGRYYFTGDNKLTTLNVKAETVEDVPAVVDQLKNVLNFTHRGIQDFSTRTRERWNAGMESWITINKRIFGGMSAICLLVGGIGIMNVMLASLNERIREIGVRKAVGATDQDIFCQFIFEAITLSLSGGILGIVASIGLIKLAGMIMESDLRNVTLMLSPEAGLAGFIFSIFVGFISGVYPAFKAARLNPINALHSE